jgi:hypothetical protein
MRIMKINKFYYHLYKELSYKKKKKEEKKIILIK